MSQSLEEVLNRPPQPPPMVEAAKDGIQAALSTLKEVGGEIWDGAKPMFDHGRTEMAAALFNGQAHVMYMRGQPGIEQGQDQAPDPALLVEAMKQPEVQQEQERGGREM